MNAVRVAQRAHGDVLGRPRTDARERGERVAQVGRVGARVDDHFAPLDRACERDQRPPAARRHGEGGRIALGQIDECGFGREKVGNATNGCGQGIPARSHQAPRDGAGPTHRDLLADHRPHG